MNASLCVNGQPISHGELDSLLAAKLQDLLGQVDWLRANEVKHVSGESHPDVDLVVTLPLPNGGTATVYVECKSELRPSAFRQLADRTLPSVGDTNTVVRVLGLPFVSQRVAELCAEHRWSWFDLAGNYRLDVPGLLRLEHTGENPVHERPKPIANLSTPEAGRVIRALLVPENAGMRWTQRHMAEHFGELKEPIPKPSLGLVNKVIRHLRDEAFIDEAPGGGFCLSDPLRLLFAWRDAYRFDRHERRGYFSLLQGKKLRDALAKLDAMTGGFAAYAAFSAAEFQAPHVRQPKTWVYVGKREISRFEEVIEAKSVDSGENLVVLIPEDEGVFYMQDAGYSDDNRLACTTAVQTYVDLWHCGGRGKEATDALLEQCLKREWLASGLKI